MKKIITTAIAASMVLGSTASAVTAQTLDRDTAIVSEDSEELAGKGLIIAIIAAIAVGVGIYLIEDGSDDNDLPTSP